MEPNNQETVRSKILRCELFISGEEFAASEMAARTRIPVAKVRPELAKLADADLVVRDKKGKHTHYRRRSLHWINAMRLSRWTPTREEIYGL